MIIHTYAYPRAGLIGNPSDGYHGRTIAFCFTNFASEVTLYQTPELEILPHDLDHSRFESIHDLAANVKQFGYYGGIRLLKASVKRFHEYCRDNGIALDDRNFTIRYQSNIPHRVGLAGSSAIITACFRALLHFYQVEIPSPILPNLILSVERDELNIAAGLQDRVAQIYEEMVSMDFDRELMERQGHGAYEPIHLPAPLPLYIAYRTDLAEGSEIFHSTLRARYDRQDPDVHEAIRYWAELTEHAREILEAGRYAELGPLLNANFDRRAEVCEISEGNRRMVEAAREVGASAKFSGSGGAIVGTYQDEAMYEALRTRLTPLHVRVFKPQMILPGAPS